MDHCQGGPGCGKLDWLAPVVKWVEKAIDVENEILFAGCRAPQMMVILSATDGKILDALPIGSTADSAIFNPETNEAYSAQIDGTLTIIRETSPTFATEQTVQTKDGAKQIVWDSRTNRILLIAADFLPPTGPPRARMAGYGGEMGARFIFNSRGYESLRRSRKYHPPQP